MTTGSTPTRVLIVDDHGAVAQGLRALIEDDPDIEVVALAGTVADAARLAVGVDVVLADYRLPDGTGADLARAVRDRPGAPAIVMISADADRRVLGQALDAGCVGFVSKNADREDLVQAVKAAAVGDSYFTRDVLRHLAHLRRFDQVDDAHLADREVEVLQLTADGQTPEQIAAALFLSVHTVKNHLRHAMAKLDAHTKLDAVLKAARLRLISIDR